MLIKNDSEYWLEKNCFQRQIRNSININCK